MKPTSQFIFAFLLAVLSTKGTSAALCDGRFLAPLTESKLNSKSLQDLANAKDDINSINADEYRASRLRGSFWSWSCLCLLVLPLATPIICMLMSRMGEEMKYIPEYALDEETATLRRVNRKALLDYEDRDSDSEVELPTWW
eukprot:gnl/MRDRNA2_/MRDRNA2_101869_c0_seq1.p1 gnl/MRDRNA2_/MRDRNA2_101869_c0~~gnl/MRDRNA2_/MRDRNA2_101869_c0_seq1.p1  ORF type:complete len:142 (+),score=18.84 gnl/MRDRNA2_/MRDRNA2_101869_c0_seq1:68-493(+)